MHATIRRYGAGPSVSGDPVRAWRALAARLGQEPGFVSCAVLAAEGGVFAAVTFFDDAASLAAADGLVERWLAAHLGPSMGRPPPPITGEVVAQRGL